MLVLVLMLVLMAMLVVALWKALVVPVQTVQHQRRVLMARVAMCRITMRMTPSSPCDQIDICVTIDGIDQMFGRMLCPCMLHALFL
mmetsp:Transcript_37442/g.84869  ORF Transcript_37442/g.84869 Transcript_37442/m.84869 type:complete len:86 (-) Transcript_37442:82-339(-)